MSFKWGFFKSGWTSSVGEDLVQALCFCYQCRKRSLRQREGKHSSMLSWSQGWLALAPDASCKRKRIRLFSFWVPWTWKQRKQRACIHVSDVSSDEVVRRDTVFGVCLNVFYEQRNSAQAVSYMRFFQPLSKFVKGKLKNYLALGVHRYLQELGSLRSLHALARMTHWRNKGKWC